MFRNEHSKIENDPVFALVPWVPLRFRSFHAYPVAVGTDAFVIPYPVF